LEGAVQYNNQVPLNVERVCKMMLTASNGSTPYERLARLGHVARKEKKGKKDPGCHSFRFS
jgi:hypothetical protein